jgi:urea carboxylase-associated protein 2
MADFVKSIEYTTELPAGWHWSLRMRKGTVLRLTDGAGTANVGMLLYNAENLLERYNAPDTLKCQEVFHLSIGHCLYSDMGRILASIVEDSQGRHDTICGTSNAAMIERKWGGRDFQTQRNEWLQNGRDAFLVELGKYGLGERDLAANVNWFSSVGVDEEGNLFLRSNATGEAASVVLRFEMDTLVVLHNCPHPLCEADEYPGAVVGLELGLACALTGDDLCLLSSPANARGFRNNALYHLGLQGEQHDAH